MENKTLMTDFYELTMVKVILIKENKMKKVILIFFLEVILLMEDMQLLVV